jgi:hypothetical protein
MRGTRLSVLAVVSGVIVVATLQPASAAQRAAGQYVLCYSNASGPFYLSADFPIDVPVAPDAKSANSDGGASRNALDALQKEFFEYLKADRGYRDSSAFPTTCQGKPSAAELVTVRAAEIRGDRLEAGHEAGRDAHARGDAGACCTSCGNAKRCRKAKCRRKAGHVPRRGARG